MSEEERTYKSAFNKNMKTGNNRIYKQNNVAFGRAT